MNIVNVTANLMPNKSLQPLNLDNVKFIVVHHLAQTTATWEQINDMHKGNGWSCAGYNEYIRKNGNVYILRGDNVGAHTQGFNSIGYGISLEGNFETEKNMADAQYKSLVERLKYNFARLKKVQAIVGHNELNNTACPGKFAIPYLEKAEVEVYAKGRVKMDSKNVVSDWAKEGYKFVSENKISDGTRPKDNVTREELWTILNNFNKLLQNKK